MNFEVCFTAVAEKRLAKIPQPERRRIVSAIIKLNEGLVGNIKPLNGRNEWRLRVGKWRIILAVNLLAKLIIVKYIDVRGDVYKK